MASASPSLHRLTAFGVWHQPMGHARIAKGAGGVLEVSNLGDGSDGVAVTLGRVEGFLPEVALPRALPNGAVLTATVRGRLGDRDQRAAALSLHGTAEGVAVVPDFSPLGTSTFRVQVFDSGRLVYERSHRQGTAAVLADVRVGRFCFGFVRISYNFARARVRLADGAEAYGDAVYMVHEGATEAVSYLSRAQLTATGISRFTLTDEEIKLFHHHHRAVGAVKLRTSPQGLLVANLAGAGEAAGVSVDINQASSWHAVLDALDTQTLPSGAQLTAATRGTIDGQADRPVVETRVRDVGDRLEATFDFSALGVSTYTAEVLRDGVVVASRSGLRGAAARFRNVGCIIDPIKTKPPAGGPVVALASPSPTMIELTDRRPVLGDTIRATPDGALPVELGAFTRFDLLSFGIPSFLIKSEASTPEVFNGHPQTAVAGSTLAERDFQLAVTGDGETAGVTSQTGDVEGVLWTVTLPDQPVPLGAVIDVRSRGTLDGVPDQPAGGLVSERTADGFMITPDFTSLGAETYELQLFRDGRMVYSQPGMRGPAALVSAAAGGSRRYCCRGVFYSCRIGAFGNVAEAVQVVGGPTVMADLLIFKHEGATRTLASHSSVVSTVHGIPSLAVSEEYVLLFGLTPHRALGRAVLDAREGRLHVSNFGADGDDGVDVEVGHFAPADRASVTWEPLDPAGTAPAGAFVQIDAVGSFDGVAGRPLGHLRVTKAAARERFDITADFSAISSPTTHVQVFASGRLVADLPGHRGPVGAASAWPLSLGKLGGTTECIVVRHPPETAFEIAGQTFLGDELRVLAEGDAGRVDFKTDLALRAAGLPELTIVSEEVVPFGGSF